MEREEERRQAFEALGRYVYEFSWLCWDFKFVITTLPSLVGRAYETVQLLTGEMTAQPLANACFAVCEEQVDHDPEAVALLRALRRQVDTEMQWRNAVVHGDWMIGWHQTTGVEKSDGTVEQVVRELPPTLTRVQAGRSGPEKMTKQEFPVSDLEAAADRVRDVRHVLEDFAWLLRGSGLTHTDPYAIADLTDVYRVSGKPKVLTRDGPMAELVSEFHHH